MIFLHNLAVSKLPYSRKFSRSSNFWTVESISILDSSSLSNRSVLSPWLWVSAIFLFTLWGIKSRGKDRRAMSWTKISRFNGNSQKSVPAKNYPIAMYAIPYTCTLTRLWRSIVTFLLTRSTLVGQSRRWWKTSRCRGWRMCQYGRRRGRPNTRTLNVSQLQMRWVVLDFLMLFLYTLAGIYEHQVGIILINISSHHMLLMTNALCTPSRFASDFFSSKMVLQLKWFGTVHEDGVMGYHLRSNLASKLRYIWSRICATDDA